MRFIVLLALLMLASCERVVDLNLPEAPRRLVVAARLERILTSGASIQAVTLSTTADYFNGEFPPPAAGAIVRVTDDLNRVVTFVETGTRGFYQSLTPMLIGRGRTYTLTIDFEGQSYVATDSTRNVPAVNSLYFNTPQGGRYSGSGGVRATINFVDPANTRNFYLWEQTVNGAPQQGPDTTVKMKIIGSDQIYNGLPVDGFQPFEGIDIPFGAIVTLRQIAISEAMYRYYFAFNDQLAGDGSPFAVQPASLRGNVQNKTNPSLPALGYFYASEVSVRTATRSPR
ncbi:MAG: DUF4249 domain-containing protein [Gemmatimonas sp.]